MTLLDLAELPDAPVTRSRPRREKATRTELVADYFREHPNKWIDGMVLESFAGRYAWRSRVSDCRKQFGMVIENRVRREAGHEHNCPAVGAWDIEDACRCNGCTFVVSEYKFVPTVSAREGE